jgi:hypothetical protein
MEKADWELAGWLGLKARKPGPSVWIADQKDAFYSFARVHSYSLAMLSVTSAVWSSLGKTPKV